MWVARSLIDLSKGVYSMDYEQEMNDLKARVAKLEERLDGLKAEVKTLYNYMERDSAGLR
jgi:uncharacterized protein YlxW (UPF0749 family)